MIGFINAEKEAAYRRQTTRNAAFSVTKTHYCKGCKSLRSVTQFVGSPLKCKRCGVELKVAS